MKRINYTQTEGISYTDQEWIFMPMTTVDSACYIKIPLYVYFVGRDGQTMDPKVYIEKYNQEIIIIKRMLTQFYSQDISFGKAEQYLYNKMVDRIQSLFKNVLVKYSVSEPNDLIEFEKY